MGVDIGTYRARIGGFVWRKRKNEKKEYLEEQFTSMSYLYKAYMQVCNQEGKTPLSRNTLMAMVKSMNIGLFHQRKDAYDTCYAYKVDNIDEGVWKIHRKRKIVPEMRKIKTKSLQLIVNAMF